MNNLHAHLTELGDEIPARCCDHCGGPETASNWLERYAGSVWGVMYVHVCGCLRDVELEDADGNCRVCGYPMGSEPGDVHYPCGDEPAF